MPSTNEKMIAWITERLRLASRADKAWTAESTGWIESETPPNGNDNPPDILPTEVAIRLSKDGGTYTITQDESKSG
jgi:hypothetical protein